MTADIVSLKLYRARREREQLVEPIIAYWPCRVKICITRVGVTQTGLDALAMFNAVLKRNGERLIDTDEVMVCSEHTNHLVRFRW